MPGAVATVVVQASTALDVQQTVALAVLRASINPVQDLAAVVLAELDTTQVCQTSSTYLLYCSLNLTKDNSIPRRLLGWLRSMSQWYVSTVRRTRGLL